MKDPAVRARIKKELAVDNWENIYFECGPTGVMLLPVNADLKKFDGKTLADVAAVWGKSPEDTLMDFILADNADTNAIDFAVSEEDLKDGLSQPWTSIGLDFYEMSLDGPTYDPNVHPRAFGSMLRFLGAYVRNQHLLTIASILRLAVY